MEPLNDFSPANRRQFLYRAGLCGTAWMTPLAHLLARAEERDNKHRPAQSILLLWLQGGPSQLETFDPHPGTAIAAGTPAIATAIKNVQFAAGLERTAERMSDLALIRSMVSKEGDHERGVYAMKTGYRPDPTILHPTLGAVCCHELAEAGVDIPRHISILPAQWPARGGFLGDGYDAFKTGDPAGDVRDTLSHTSRQRDEQRLHHLEVVESAFARGRAGRIEATGHRETMNRARKMMTSEQLRAFEVAREPLALRRAYGDTPFGRACLAARRLVEVGVRCVEVTLDGWDSHVNNHAIQGKLVAVLDPALSALLRDLRERDLLKRTLVVVAGEFGRTPKLNAVGGRDHWPNGFSVALAGGGIRGGRVVGATDPEGKDKPTRPVSVGDLHATLLKAVGIDPKKIHRTPIGRTLRFSEGQPVAELLE